MGKLTGYILGVSAALLVAYYILMPYYTPLLDWLGPYFGAPLAFILPILFLLMGNPIEYPVIIGSWIIISFFVAAGARRGGRSAGTAFTVYLSILGFLGVSTLALLFSAHVLSGVSSPSISLSSLTGILSTPPAGTNLYTIESEPLVGTIVGIASSYVSVFGATSSAASGSPSISQIISSLEANFLVYLIINLVIFLVASYIFGRLFQRMVRPRKNKPSGVVAALVVIAVVAGGFAVLTDFSQHSSSIPHYHSVTSQEASVSSVQYTDSSGIAQFSPSFAASAIKGFTQSGTGSGINSTYFAAGIVGKYGDVYNLYAMAGLVGNAASSQWYGTAAARASNFTLVIYTYNLTQIADALSADQIINGTGILGSSTIGNLLNIVPQVIVIEGYNGSTLQYGSAAAQNANNIISLSGGTGTKLLISLNLSSSSAFPGFSGSIYVFSGAMAWPGNLWQVISPVTGKMNQSGPLVMFEDGLKTGYLIPGNGTGSVQASITVAGIINPSMFNSTLLKDLGVAGTNVSLSGDRIAIAGGVFYKAGVFHSSSTLKTISYSTLFHYSQPVKFESAATLYLMAIGYPVSSTSGHGNAPAYNYTTYASSSNYSSSYNFNGNNTPIPVNYGSSLDLASENFTTNAAFPANLSITTTASGSGGVYRISTTVVNHDTDTLTGVSISDNRTVAMYSGYLTKIGGNSTFITKATLDPGSTITFSFNVSVRNFGVFTLQGANVNYSSNGERFNVTGTPEKLAVPPPSFLNSVVAAEYGAISGAGAASPLGFLTVQMIPGFYTFELIAVLVLLLDAFLEVRAFRRWRKGRAEKKE
ncbi:MAG: autotransporter outer membrane beta-barrel domain-containing protein [Thermoplasmataceae archaeon]